MNYLIDSGLPTYPAGLSDKDASLVLPLYRAVNSLSQKVSVATGNIQTPTSEMPLTDQLDQLLSHRTNKVKVRAAEAVGFGQLVNLFLTGGVIEARLADATTTSKPCHGICDVVTGLAAGQWGEIIFMSGRSQGIAGSVFGSKYYLSTTPGAVQLFAPGGGGNLVQIVGVGLGSAGFYLQVTPG